MCGTVADNTMQNKDKHVLTTKITHYDLQTEIAYSLDSTAVALNI